MVDEEEGINFQVYLGFSARLRSMGQIGLTGRMEGPSN